MLEINNIFTSNIDNLAIPQVNYLFKVSFEHTNSSEKSSMLAEINTMDDAVSMTATLPKADVKTVQQWFKGTVKTRIVNMDRSGETTLSFILRRTGLDKLSAMFGLPGNDLSNQEFIHTEFEQSFDQLTIYLLKSNAYKADYINTKGDVAANITQEDQYDEDGELLKEGNVATKFILYNTIVTQYSFTDLDYASSDIVKLSVTLHYDYWSCK